MDTPADVFISYSREDKDRVLELASRLRAAGVSVWIDQGGIDGATLWGEEIVNALDRAKVLLLAVSSAAARSHNVAKEVVLVSERKGHILPVDFEPTTMPPGLKYALAGIQHVEYFQGDPDENLKTILRSLERAGVTITRPSERKAVDGANEAAGRPTAAQGAAGAEMQAAPGRARGAALRQHQLRPGDGLFQRRADRGADRAAVTGRARSSSSRGGPPCSTRARSQDIRGIGNELGARYIVGGSVRTLPGVGAHHGAARRRRRRIARSGAIPTRASWTTSSTSRSRSRARSSRR